MDDKGEVIAVAWLIAHAVVSTARAIATVELFIFKEELGGMDEGSVHLIIYIRAGKDMIDALPLALITIGATDTVLSLRLLSKITETMPIDLLEDRAIRTVVEVTGYNEFGIWRDGMDGVYRLK